MENLKVAKAAEHRAYENKGNANEIHIDVRDATRTWETPYANAAGNAIKPINKLAYNDWKNAQTNLRNAEKTLTVATAAHKETIKKVKIAENNVHDAELAFEMAKGTYKNAIEQANIARENVRIAKTTLSEEQNKKLEFENYIYDFWTQFKLQKNEISSQNNKNAANLRQYGEYAAQSLNLL